MWTALEEIPMGTATWNPWRERVENGRVHAFRGLVEDALERLKFSPRLSGECKDESEEKPEAERYAEPSQT